MKYNETIENALAEQPSNLDSVDVVYLATQVMDESQKQTLLESAVTGMLRSAAGNEDDPTMLVRKIFHKIQSKMSAEAAQQFSQTVYDKWNVDARNPKWIRRRSCRTIGEFVERNTGRVG